MLILAAISVLFNLAIKATMIGLVIYGLIGGISATANGGNIWNGILGA